MASTFSPLKVELIATGEQSGTWGSTTNVNLGTALEEAITGSADVTFASGNVTVTLTDVNTTQTARNLRLNLVGTSSGTHSLILGAGCNIEKLYLVNNTLANPVTVVNTAGGTSITVPAAKSMLVYNTGTNVVDAVTHVSSLTSGTITGTTITGTTVNATTVDTTNLEVTTLKAKDGTTAGSIADATGIVSLASSVLTTTDINGGTIDGASVGATTPNTGAFTALSSTGNTTLGDASADTITLNGTVQPGVVVSGSSSGDAFRITQTGTGNAFVVEDSASPDATPFVIDANGDVIVGSTASILGGRLQVYSPNPLSAVRYGSANPPIITLASTTASIGNNVLTSLGAILGRYVFSGDDGTNFIQAARIDGAVDGTPATNSMPGRLVFSTTPSGSATPVERMRINSEGSVGIGGVANSNENIRVSKATSGTIPRGIIVRPTIQSDATVTYFGFSSFPATVAVSFTLPNLSHFRADQGTFGAGSSITNQYGFVAEANLIGATNNYGFFSNIPAGTGRFNFYANGTADNYFAGAVGIGTTTPDASALLDVQSTTKGVRMPNMTTTQKNAIASPAVGLIVFDTTLGKLSVRTASAWETITSA